jgi:hypothetical protein
MSEETTMSEQDKKDILGMDEATTYFLINECGLFLFRMNHDLADGRIPEESNEAVKTDMINIREVQTFTVENLQRFGVDPETVEDKENGDYWKWYTFWDKWKENLTDEQWKVVSTGEYKEYLPKAKWNDEKPSQEEQPEE